MQNEYILEINVTKDNVKITNKEKVHNGEYKATKCVFAFSEDFDGLTKKAIFEAQDILIEMLILDNECDIPIEVLSSEYYQCNLRVYGYETGEVNGEQELKLRYSPTYDTFPIYKGSYIENAQNTEPITPTDKEQIEQAITNLEDTKQDLLISGENLKTINNESLLGSGNLEVITDLSDYYTKEKVYNKTEVNTIQSTIETNTGARIEMSINTSTYVLTLSLKNSAGTVLNTQTVDLPLESVVVNGSYDSTNKKIILTLESGSTIEIPVGDLISGLQSEITNENKLNSDLVDDTNQTNKFVTAAEKTTWNNKSDFSGNYNDLSNKPDLTVYATTAYVDNIVGDIETILTTLDVGGGVS